MILVITHDGRLPKDGGKRIGYQVGDWLFHIPSGQTFSVSALLALNQPAQAAKQAEVPTPHFASRSSGGAKGMRLPVYSQLHYCGSWHSCINCGSFDNPERYVETADEGKVLLVICSNCGTQMRPQ